MRKRSAPRCRVVVPWLGLWLGPWLAVGCVLPRGGAPEEPAGGPFGVGAAMCAARTVSGGRMLAQAGGAAREGGTATDAPHGLDMSGIPALDDPVRERAREAQGCANSMMIVTAYRGASRLAQWSGPTCWAVSCLPIGGGELRFDGEVGADGAIDWPAFQPSGIRVGTDHRGHGGTALAKWLPRGATSVVIVIRAGYGSGGGSRAGETVAGVAGDGSAGDDEGDGNGGGDRLGSGGGDGLGSGDGSGDGNSALGSGNGGGGDGLDSSGPRSGSGSSAPRGDGAGPGTSASGSRGGVKQDGPGATRQSWTQPTGAPIDNVSGGRTPSPDGRRGGSAGGERGATGHLMGGGIVVLIDLPASVATVVNAALTIVNADFAGLTQRVFNKALRLPLAALRKELAHEIDDVVSRAMVAARAQPEYAAMVAAEGDVVDAMVAQELRHEALERARRHFAREAEDAERAARVYGAGSPDHHRHLANMYRENAIAYRKLEQAAADEAQLIPTPASGPQRGTALGADEARTMHVTSARGAGVTRGTQRHHLLPQEHKAWFQARGFPGDDIDNFCIELDDAIHQATHGGGDWKLARKAWPEGEWNTALMSELQAREAFVERRLLREEILVIARERLVKINLGHLEFVPYRRPR